MTNLNSAELNTLINKINANTNTQGEQTMSEVNNVNNELETNWQHIIDGLKIWAFWVGISGYAGFITSGGNGMNIYESEVIKGSYQDGSFYPGHAKLAGLKFMLQASYPVTLIAFVASPLVANLFPRTIATFINGVLGIKEVDFYETEEGKAHSIFQAEYDALVEAHEAKVANAAVIPNIFSLEYANPVMINGVSMSEKRFKLNVYGNYKNGIQELVVRYNNEAISWGGKAYNFNTNLMEVLMVGDEPECSKSSPKQLLARILETLATKKHLREAQTFLSGLVGTVLVTEWKSSEENPNAYNTAAILAPYANLVDNQEVIRRNEVVAYRVNSFGHILIKSERDMQGVWVKGCLKGANELFGLTFPDKTNTKRGFCDNALIVMGIVVNGENQIYSIVDADKEGKFYNRHASVKHIAAEFPAGVVAADNLLNELSDGKFGFSAGVRQNSLYLFSSLLSLAVGDGGFVARKPMTYISNKRIEGSINLDNLFTANAEYKAAVIKAVGSDRKAQLAFVMKDAEESLVRNYAGVSIASYQSLKFQGLDIAVNDSEVAVVLSEKAPVVVSEGVALGTEVRTIDCSFHTKALVVDYNYKARGQWFKGMATRNDEVIVKNSDGAEVETEVIFCRNSDKNRKITLIRMWANAFGHQIALGKDGNFYFLNFNNETNSFEKGEVVDFEAVLEEINSKLVKSLNVSLVTTQRDFDTFKKANPSAFAFVNKTEELKGGKLRIEFSCEGMEAPLVYAVELSSVEENFAAGRKLPPIQAELMTTFAAANSIAARKIQEKSLVIANTIKIARSSNVDARYSEENCDAWVEIFNDISKNKNNPKDVFFALSKKFPNGVKISGSVDGSRSWNVSIPFHVISVLGSFKNSSGYSHDDVINNTYAFLCLLAEKSVGNAHLIADYAFNIDAALKGWKKDVVKSNKAFTKGAGVFQTHGMKVLSNGGAASEMHNGVSIPVILVDESNPLVLGTARGKNGKFTKKVVDGDVVFFYRNPMVDLTPAIIRVTKSQTVCGPFTCALSPSILAWSSQTDNDGDVLWVVPANQVGVTNINSSKIIDGRTPAQAVASLMNHPVIQNKDGFVADQAIKAAGCGDLYSGIVKVDAPITNLKPTHKVTIDIVAEAEAVANHYRIRVGQGYSAMFNAYSSFIRKYNKGETISTEELLGIKICSFVLYEEWGLAGYSADNEARFNNVETEAKVLLGLVKRKASFGMFSKVSGALGPNGRVPLDYAADFLAQQKVQSKIERNPNFAKGSVIREEALVTGLFRTLTKGAFALDGETISEVFSQAKDDAGNYAVALNEWKSFAASGLTIK